MSNWNSIGSPFSDFIKKVEGGWANHPQDPGKETNMGVTIGAWQQLAPKLLGIPGTVATLKNLTKEQHMVILKYYWDASRGESYRNAAIAAYATELAWGSGQGGAKKMLRKAAAALGKTLSANSTMTANDVAILNSLNSAELFDAITAARWNFYKSLSTWPVFGKGWSARINEFITRFKKKALI